MSTPPWDTPADWWRCTPRRRWCRTTGSPGATAGGTSVGRYFDTAWAKALAREQLLLVEATPRTELSTSVGIGYWLSPERPKPKGSWGESHTKTMTYCATRHFRPVFGGVEHLDLRRAHVQLAVNLARSASR